jgi:hypothetical protein
MNRIWRKLNICWQTMAVCWLSVKICAYLQSILPPEVWPLVALALINLVGCVLLRFILDWALHLVARWEASR